MDTDQLRQFLCVAQHGNITRAAEELAISQPALSRSMQRLEEEMGRPLLERKTRSVGLTEAGVLFRARAEEILGLIDDTRNQISDDGQTGQVRVAAIPTVAPYFLPGLLKDFADAFPSATLVVQEDTTDRLLHRLKQGEIDLAVMAAPIDARYLDSSVLFEEELLLVAPAEHALAKSDRVTLEDLQPHPFVLLGEAHCLADQVVSFCNKRNVQPLSVERATQLATVQELVALGHGVSMAPAMARRLDSSDSRVYRSLDGDRPSRTIIAVWNPYRFQNQLLIALRERLSAYAASFAADVSGVTRAAS